MVSTSSEHIIENHEIGPDESEISDEQIIDDNIANFSRKVDISQDLYDEAMRIREMFLYSSLEFRTSEENRYKFLINSIEARTQAYMKAYNTIILDHWYDQKLKISDKRFKMVNHLDSVNSLRTHIKLCNNFRVSSTKNSELEINESISKLGINSITYSVRISNACFEYTEMIDKDTRMAERRLSELRICERCNKQLA